MENNNVAVIPDSLEIKEKTAYIVGLHPYSYNSGKRAMIVGVRLIKPSKNLDWRPCFMVSHTNGKIDYIPISEIGTNYKIVTKSEKIKAIKDG